MQVMRCKVLFREYMLYKSLVSRERMVLLLIFVVLVH